MAMLGLYEWNRRGDELPPDGNLTPDEAAVFEGLRQVVEPFEGPSIGISLTTVDRQIHINAWPLSDSFRYQKQLGQDDALFDAFRTWLRGIEP